MGVFPPPVPDAFVAPINMISYVGTFVGDPWILADPTEVETYGDTMSLSPAEKTCSVIQSESASTICPPMEGELDQYSLPEWANIPSSLSHDFLNAALLSDEAIIKAMTLSERPWEDNHHRSSILPPLNEEDPPLIHCALQSSTLSLQSLGSSAPRVMLSRIVSSLPASQDLVPLPSSSNGETLMPSNHTYQRTKCRGAGAGSGNIIERLQPLGIMLVTIFRRPPLIILGAAYPCLIITIRRNGRTEQSHRFKLAKKWSSRAKSSFQAR